MEPEPTYDHIEEQLDTITKTYTLASEAYMMPAERIRSLMNYLDDEIRQQIRDCRDEVVLLPHSHVKRSLLQMLYQYEWQATMVHTVLYLLIIKSKVQPHFNVLMFLWVSIFALRLIGWLF